jgi:acetyl esterase/lipase
VGGTRKILTGAIACCAALIAASAAGAASSAPPLPTSDPFYSYSGSLAATAPGTILKQRPVTLVDSGQGIPVTAIQVLYRTTGQLGQPTATVATILEPATGTAAPKLVSYQMAYDALGAQCDPSWTMRGGMPAGGTTNTDEEQFALGLVASGDIVVVPDYEGTHLDWAAGQESGYNTLDAIRAADNALKLPPSTPTAMVGYSGGSIATEFASELATRYAPELKFVGVAEGGIPVDFEHNLSYINGSPSWSGVIPAVLVSLGRAFGLDLKPYLSAYGFKLTKQVGDECINNFIGAWPHLRVQQLLKPAFQNPYTIPAVVRIDNELIMSRTGTPTEPLLMGVGDADGTGDGVMVTNDVRELAHTYCQRGVSVELHVYNGDDHTNAAIAFLPTAGAWMSERLNGVPAQNGCGSIAAGNALTPLAPAPELRLAVARARLHGVLLYLHASTGAMSDLTVGLRRGGRLIARVGIERLGTARRRLVVGRGKALRSGRYTLTVTEEGVSLLRRAVRVR